MVTPGTYIRTEEIRNKNSEAAKKQVYQTGWHHSSETREKIASSNIGKKHTEECKQKIGQKSKGHTVSEETRLKISMAKIGVKRAPYSEEWRRNLSESGKRRDPPTEETRKKISAANRGRTRSEESKQKIRLAKIGTHHAPHSEETIERMRIAAKARPPLSEESREKISKSIKERFKDPKNHPRWRGGISFEPYCEKFKPEFKERVREFFGRVCVECGTPENGRKLDVHHVNFDKSSCCSDVEPLFVALCRRCHVKTNGDREHWEQHFTELIMTKFNGQCYLSKVI